MDRPKTRTVMRVIHTHNPPGRSTTVSTIAADRSATTGTVRPSTAPEAAAPIAAPQTTH